MSYRNMNLPNRLTFLRMLMVPLFILCFYLGIWLSWGNWLAAVVFLLADLTDVVDGYIARSRNLVTNFGKLMDPIADKLLFCSAFILLTWQNKLPPVVCIVFIGREIIVSGFRLVTAAGGRVIAANWLGKLKTGLQVVGILVMLLFDEVFSAGTFRFDLAIMYLATGFTIWSAADYIIKNKEAVKWD